MTETRLTEEISAFDAQRPRLLRQFGPSWVVILNRVCEGAFATFEEAASFATARFPTGAFLIRHTEAPEPQIPFVIVDS